MAITTINFENPENYIYDENEIEINKKCGLKNIGGETPVYSKDNPQIKLVVPLPARKIKSASFDLDSEGGDDVRFVMIVNDKEYYHNGTDWVESNGYAGSNSAEEISNNITDLISELSAINFLIYLHSENGTTTPQLNRIQVETLVLITENENRNSFCTLEKAKTIINAYPENSHAFMLADDITKEKALLKAFSTLTRFMYCVDLSRFDTLSLETQNAFIRAQCEQCVNILSPESAAGIMRDNGITEINANGEKLEINMASKYVICPEARHQIEKYIDDEISIL